MKTLVAIMLSVSLLAGAGIILPNHATAMGKKSQTLCACGSGKPASECCLNKGKKCACGSGKLASQCCAASMPKPKQ